MTGEDYRKLNNYLNECMKRLEKNHFFLLRNIEPICEMSDKYVHVLKQYELKDEYPKESTLTFEDVYLLAREIVADINPMYLNEYDKILSSGELDFSYDQEHFDNHFQYSSDEGIGLININRNFNYLEVCSLIHEFMHKMNFDLSKKSSTPTRTVLTEFISIYFEEYAKRYLLNKGISKKELFFNERIMATQNSASNFNWYGLILLVYEMIGKIDEESYLFLRENYLPITKEGFEKECKMVVDQITKIEAQYQKDIMYERPFNENEVYDRCSVFLSKPYQYVFGTLLAYYALENIDKEKMVWLNDHVNDDGQTVLDILEQIGMDLDDIPIIDLVTSVEKQIELVDEKVIIW